MGQQAQRIFRAQTDLPSLPLHGVPRRAGSVLQELSQGFQRLAASLVALSASAALSAVSQGQSASLAARVKALGLPGLQQRAKKAAVLKRCLSASASSSSGGGAVDAAEAGAAAQRVVAVCLLEHGVLRSPQVRGAALQCARGLRR